MLYSFSKKTADMYFPDFKSTEWKFLSYVKYMPESNVTACVNIMDYDKPSETGAWSYSIYEADGDITGLPVEDIINKSKFVSIVPGLFTDINLEKMSGSDNELPLVVAVCGPSGSGKTSLVNNLKKLHDIPTIISYTTRPKRDNETDGEQHWFVTEDKMPPKEQMLAYTLFANNHYWSDIKDLENHKAVTYTIDEQGILDLLDLEKLGKIRVVWIQVERPDNPTDKERLERDSVREPAQKRLNELGIRPNAIIVNNYASVDEFLEKETKEVATFIDMMTDGLKLPEELNNL